MRPMAPASRLWRESENPSANYDCPRDRFNDRNGLGQLLMNEILPAARQNGVATLFLEVHENSQKFN